MTLVLAGVLRAGVVAACVIAPLPASAVEIAPHRAIYTMTLDHATTASGVVGASGTMLFQWADVCDGWVIEQRYRLRMQYQEQDDVELLISFVTWESKDGTRYRFNVKKLRDGEPDEDVRGEATVRRSGTDAPPDQARFSKPEATEIALPPDSLFPTAHTLSVIDAARKGAAFLAKTVFDGGTVDGAFAVSAGIGREHPGDPTADQELLRQRWWPVRLAFFPPDSSAPEPDYELGMDLQENGVARNMMLDYGGFVVRAALAEIEPLPRQGC